MNEPYTAMQVVMMPRDTNPHGTIFGGVILSYIDLAGSVAAKRELLARGGAANLTFVTVAINRVEFKQPVLVGDVVKFQTTVVRVGKSSMTFHVDVIAERGAESIPVTDAEIVYVCIDSTAAERKPVVMGITATK